MNFSVSTLRYIPPKDLNLREVDYASANSYCQSLNVDHSHLWCPASTEENFLLWWHHNGQPFAKTDGPAIWTGIIRLSSSGLFNADGWTCNNLFDQEYFNWIGSQPSFVNWWSFLPEWNTVLTCNTPQWDDINDSDPAAVVCEMMCQLEEEPPAPATTEPSTTAAPEPTTVVTTAPPCPAKSTSGQQEVSISANTGLHDALSQLVCEDTVIQIINHGCHCIAIDRFGLVVDYTGGYLKLDIVDEHCQRWRQARKCLTLPGSGGSCHGLNIKDSSYTVKIDYDSDVPEFDCSGLSESCYRDLCLVDAHFAKEIAALAHIAANNFTEILGDEYQCPKKKGKGASACEGQAPDLVLLKD